MMSIKETKVIHPVWEQMEKAKREIPGMADLMAKVPPAIGKYHWIFESPKGKITLIQVPSFSFKNLNKMVYEACSSDVFWEGTRRFETKKEAMKVINKCLS